MRIDSIYSMRKGMRFALERLWLTLPLLSFHMAPELMSEYVIH